MLIVELGIESERYLKILRDSYEVETGNESTILEMLDSVIKLTYQEIYEDVVPGADDGEAYFGVTIPFSEKSGAELGLERVCSELGYGGWIRNGNFNED